MTENAWALNGGDFVGAIDALAQGGREGAHLRIELRRLGTAGSQDEEGAIRRNVWDAVVSTLPLGVVGRRTAWSRFEFALKGSQAELVRIGHQLMTTLRIAVGGSGRCSWRVVFTRAFDGEAERTLFCDPEYDLAARGDAALLAWVEPYPGADWRESQRYPNVTLLAEERAAGRGDPS